MIYGLISCSKSKLDYRTEARYLYQGALFKKSQEYVERRCDQYAIISARHGLLLPRQLVSPYETNLYRMTKAEKQGLAVLLRQQVEHHCRDSEKVIALMPDLYADMLQDVRIIVEYPLYRMKLGPRLALLNKWLSE